LTYGQAGAVCVQGGIGLACGGPVFVIASGGTSMKRVALLALVLAMSASIADARLASNRLASNGVSLNSAGSESGVVQTITLASGAVLTVEPAN
jgi:hypothetical protein